MFAKNNNNNTQSSIHEAMEHACNVRGGMVQPYAYESSCVSPRKTKSYMLSSPFDPKKKSRLIARLSAEPDGAHAEEEGVVLTAGP